MRSKFCTWEGAMKMAKALRLLGVDAHSKKEWWGYLVELKSGRDCISRWKQAMCTHLWDNLDGRKMMSRSMNTCIRCGCVKAGPS